jgi:phosphatidate cytidylyltransferase
LSEARSSLLLRVISAAVLLPTTLFLLFRGGWWFFALVFLLLTLAAWEYVQMLRHLAYRPLHVFAILLVWAILLSFHLADQSIRSERYLQPAVALLLFASLSWHVLGDRTATRVENWLLPLAGALYIGWTGGHLLLLRALPQGAHRLFVTLGIIWLADTGAYFIGKAWGTHRMAPRLSPKKTWEGMAGGIVVALISGPILTGLLGLGWWHGAILGLLLSTLAPLGDLGVSMIKRQAGVKDSSNLIPGHGGAFDRVDSLLIAAIVGYYYQVWVMGA